MGFGVTLDRHLAGRQSGLDRLGKTENHHQPFVLNFRIAGQQDIASSSAGATRLVLGVAGAALTLGRPAPRLRRR